MSLVAIAPDGKYCLDEQSAKNVMINIERYKGSLDRCNAIINTYNATVKP